MKNFSLKNIALVLAVLFGTAAAYSAHDDFTDDVLGCRKPTKPITKPTQKPCSGVPEDLTFKNAHRWEMELVRGQATYKSGPLSVVISECGKVGIEGFGCISQQMNKEIVQAVSLGKILFAADAKFSACHLRDLLARYEECPCPQAILVRK